MLDFIAIDFETANSHRGSPCSVGLVRFRDGIAVAERHWLIRPPEKLGHFSGFNIGIHGITPDMVANAPRWNVLLPEIVNFIAGDVVVAHSAGFDIGVIRAACVADGIEWPALEFLCTRVLAQRAFSLPSYGLPFVSEACGVTLQDHHDALADARAVGDIVRAMTVAGGVSSLQELALLHGVHMGRMAAGLYAGTGRAGPRRALVAGNANPEADPDGYLYGRVVVFTGKLETMERPLAWEAVVRSGGVPEENTTKRTNVLVLGDFNVAHLRPGTNLSGKAQKAFTLQGKGQDIEVMTEADFLRVLDESEGTTAH